MEQDLSIASTYLSRVMNAPGADLLDSEDMIIAKDGKIRVGYAPFDHIARSARIVVVGITPGRVQAHNALNAARRALGRGASVPGALAEAKLTGSFSGPIRSNLVAMLDAIGVAEHLDVVSTAELFNPGSEAVHFTSALRYPVFVNGKNYNGAPDMLRTPVLRRMVDTHLGEEARLLPEALWLPLGPKARAAVEHLAKEGLLNEERILSGLPHPSGANAERIAIFLGRKAPQLASSKTNAKILLAAFEALTAQVAALKGLQT